MSNDTPIKSVYRRGADDGLIFGIYLSVMMLSIFQSVAGQSALCAILAFLLIVGVPVVIYIFLKRGYRAEGCRSQFSAIWLHGICIFFFGSLLMALTAYIYLRIINPTFIPDILEFARQTYAELGTADAKVVASTISNMQRNNAYPTAGGVAVELIMTAVFTGSILSMLLSLLIRAITRCPKTPPTPPPYV